MFREFFWFDWFGNLFGIKVAGNGGGEHKVAGNGGGE